MGLNPRVLQQWTDMLGGVAVPPNIKAPPQAKEQAVRIVRLLVDDDYLVALLEQQPRMSSIDYILSLRIWQDEGITEALTSGLSGLIRFASIATPSEYISRARRMLTTTIYDEPPLWHLPSYLTEQAASAEQNWRQGFSQHSENTTESQHNTTQHNKLPHLYLKYPVVICCCVGGIYIPQHNNATG